MSKEYIANRIITVIKEDLNNGDILDGIYHSLAYDFYYNFKYDTYLIDAGYDISEYPKDTKQHFKLEDYKTVGDFLKEYTGNTVATYISGNGISAETYEDDIEEQLDNAISHIINDIFAEYKINKEEEDSVRDDIYDKLIENNLSGIAILETIVKTSSFKDMILKHKDIADNIYKTRLDEESEKEEIIINNNKISQSICNDFLLFKDKTEKFTSEDIADLKMIIKSLKLKFGEKNIKIFIESDYFKKNVSNSLFDKFQLIVRTL
ncbi:MAG: hypothetical protein ACYCSW_06595 [bacterium]